MRKTRILLFIFGLWVTQTCLARELAVITDKANSSSSFSSTDLLKLLKTDAPKWPDGKKITIFLPDPSSADGQLVLLKIYKLTPDEVKALLASHKAHILTVDSDENVMKAVAEHPGSIGFVNVYSINSAVKVLKIDGKLPFEQGYLFHGN
jgi:ABC-type phosphate transport system substrate-binding protein